MTNKEKINELEWIYQNGFTNDLNIVGTDRILDAIRSGIDSLEKAEKYKWHDLRKNPEDLPEDGSYILTFHELLGRQCYGICEYNNKQFEDGINPSCLIKESLIAWQYIEPFEEEE